MADIVLVQTGPLRQVYQSYETLRTSASNGSFPVTAGFDRSQGHAESAAGTVGAAISAMVSAIGELGTAVHDVTKWYGDTDMCVQHGFDRYR